MGRGELSERQQKLGVMMQAIKKVRANRGLLEGYHGLHLAADAMAPPP